MGIKKRKQPPQDEANTLKDAGNKAFSLKKFEEAIDKYTQAIHKNSQHHVFFANRANAYLEWGKLNECIQDCDQAIKIEDTYIKSYFRKARAQRDLGFYKEALMTLENGAKKSVDNKENEQIMSMIDEISEEIRLENMMPKDHPEIVDFNQFDQWIQKEGAIINKVKAKWEHVNSRCLVASEDIQVGDDLVSIPMNHWLTTYHVCEEEASELCYKLGMIPELQTDLEGWSYALFAIFFAEQKKNCDSKYKMYLKSLPQNIQNFPELFDYDQLKWLEGSIDMLNLIKDKTAQRNQDYELLVKYVPEIFEKVSFTEFQECYILATLRAYDIVFDDGLTRQVLIPYLDMSPINHGKQENTTTLQLNGFITFQASKEILKGEGLVQAQTIACNSKNFLLTGFIADNNESRNKLNVQLKLDSEDQLLAFKLQCLGQKENITQKFIMQEDLQSENVQKLLSWLRFSNQKNKVQLSSIVDRYNLQRKNQMDLMIKGQLQELEIGQMKPEFDALNIICHDVLNEANTLTQLQLICNELINEYNTTYQEDLQMLEQDSKDHKLSNNRRNCLLLQIGEKRILENLKQTSIKLASILTTNTTVKMARKAIDKFKNFNQNKYCDEVIIPLLRQQQQDLGLMESPQKKQ